MQRRVITAGHAARTPVGIEGERGLGRDISFRQLGTDDERVREGLSVLETLLLESLATGTIRVHVEIDGDTVLARLRRPDGLETRRLTQATALSAALNTLDTLAREVGDLRPIEIAPAAPQRLAIDSLVVRGGASWCLTVTPDTPHPPLLDELVSDPVALDRLVGRLDACHGLIAMSDAEPERLACLADAIAQRCVAPDRKVLRVQGRSHHRLPGAMQVDLSSIAPDRRDATCRALLAHDADVIVADAELPPGIAPLLDAVAAHRLVVRMLQIPRTGCPLLALRADGADGHYLAERLRAIVRIDLLRELCGGCRHSLGERILPARPDDTAHAASPARRWLAASLDRFAEADGCTLCFGTGFGHIEPLVDVIDIGPALSQALREDAFGDAALLLATNRRVPAHADALWREGRLSARETARLIEG